ncbi:coiled-coil domain-containing protein 138-like isoform X3 [Puntigrus tetrazona]|uniref:coiled-coil domain-containing protein 138-like isoform X3 n=1 Tax=Puntigrus tetrazona TaxID=1606681 RepID=UPI001C8AB6E3|nr:coiled-coil domain-containing protein 138-like isoform X3 [Puntigrus tetrazona]
MKNDSDSDLDEKIEILKQKYLQRRKQVQDASDDDDDDDDEGAGITRDVCRPRRADSAEDEEEPSEEDDAPEETNVFFTETDVTLPSDLRSSSSSALNRGRSRCVLHVFQEMMHIYEKLQAERVSQQAWASQLCERECDLQQRETVFQSSVQTLRVQQEELRHLQKLKQQFQQEKSELEAALKHKTKENKRMKANFDSLKELNDSLKKQLNEVSEQNRKLESQSRKVQARLENLQRRYESFSTHRSRETAAPKACDPKPSRPEKPPSNKAAGKAAGPLLKLLLDWLVEGQLMEGRLGPRPSPHERCARVLPMLVEQLHGATETALSLLRCIYCCLLHLERGSQHTVLTSTLRRLGEEVSRGSPGVSPLLRSSCLHTRVLSSLLVLKTLAQVDVLAQAVEVLSGAVRSDEGQALFLEYQALPVVLALLRAGSPGLLAPSLDVLLQMSSGSPGSLPVFLDQCSSEDFFRCSSLVLRHPRLEPAPLEKMLVLLQKLSGVRKNKRLFKASSLGLLLQEMHRTSDHTHTHTFISINLSSILLNLGMLSHP